MGRPTEMVVVDIVTGAGRNGTVCQANNKPLVMPLVTWGCDAVVNNRRGSYTSVTIVLSLETVTNDAVMMNLAAVPPFPHGIDVEDQCEIKLMVTPNHYVGTHGRWWLPFGNNRDYRTAWWDGKG